MKKALSILITAFLVITPSILNASKLADVKIVDKDFILLYFKDGDVTFNEDLKFLGSNAYTNGNPGATKNKVVWYGNKLDTAAILNLKNWTIVSNDDSTYGTAGLNPLACYRKSKLNGMAELDWVGSDYKYDYSREHSIYLKLPQSVKFDYLLSPGRAFQAGVRQEISFYGALCSDTS